MDDTRVKNRRCDRLWRYDLYKRHTNPSTGSQVKHHRHAHIHTRTHAHSSRDFWPSATMVDWPAMTNCKGLERKWSLSNGGATPTLAWRNAEAQDGLQACGITVWETWVRFIWLKTRPICGLLWTPQRNFKFQHRQCNVLTSWARVRFYRRPLLVAVETEVRRARCMRHANWSRYQRLARWLTQRAVWIQRSASKWSPLVTFCSRQTLRAPSLGSRS